MNNNKEDWHDIRYLHVPTGKIYKLNGAGGMIREDNSTNVPFPLWLKDNSKDFIKVGTKQAKTIEPDMIKTIGFASYHHGQRVSKGLTDETFEDWFNKQNFITQ